MRLNSLSELNKKNVFDYKLNKNDSPKIQEIISHKDYLKNNISFGHRAYITPQINITKDDFTEYSDDKLLKTIKELDNKENQNEPWRINKRINVLKELDKRSWFYINDKYKYINLEKTDIENLQKIYKEINLTSKNKEEMLNAINTRLAKDCFENGSTHYTETKDGRISKISKDSGNSMIKLTLFDTNNIPYYIYTKPEDVYKFL